MESFLKVFLEIEKLSKRVVRCIYSLSGVLDFEY